MPNVAMRPNTRPATTVIIFEANLLFVRIVGESTSSASRTAAGVVIVEGASVPGFDLAGLAAGTGVFCAGCDGFAVGTGVFADGCDDFAACGVLIAGVVAVDNVADFCITVGGVGVLSR